MLHVGQIAEAIWRSRSISFDQPAVGARQRGPAGLVRLGEAGVGCRAGQGGELGQCAALDHRQPLIASEPGHVGHRVRVVVGVHDRDDPRGITVRRDAVGGPKVRPVEPGLLSLRCRAIEVRLGPSQIRGPVQVERSRDAGASRLTIARLGADVRVLMTPARGLRRRRRRSEREHQRGRSDDRRKPPTEARSRHLQSPVRHDPRWRATSAAMTQRTRSLKRLRDDASCCRDGQVALPSPTCRRCRVSAAPSRGTWHALRARVGGDSL